METTRGEKPPWDEISHEGGDLKALYGASGQNLEVKDGLLCQRFIWEEIKNVPGEGTCSHFSSGSPKENSLRNLETSP